MTPRNGKAGAGGGRARGPAILGALASVLVVACQGAEPEPDRHEPLVSFDTVAASIVTATDTIALTVEVADTDERRRYGLMERSHVPERHGMLFTYAEAQGPGQGFWMYRTLVPLDIAFLDDAGRVVAILSMDPCRSPNPELCRLYAPGVSYHSALEVGQGLLDEWGVETGDRVLVGQPASPD